MVDLKYIIFDLEFNQSCNKEDKVLQLPFEIIQIGALKLDENFKTISTLKMIDSYSASLHSRINKDY